MLQLVFHSKEMDIFVYRPGAIGDTVLTLPALAALRSKLPGCEITYAGNTAMLPLLPVEHALSADDSRLLPLFTQPPQPWPEANLHVIFARRPAGLPGILRDPLQAPARGIHMVDWLVDAVEPAFEDRTPRLDLQPVAGGELVLHPGAGSPTKRWPAARFAELARRLDLPLAVVRGPADMDIDIPVPHQQWNNLPLPELARRLAGSRLFAGNDSGISHLAAAAGAPTLAIYVSTDPAIWGIRGRRTHILAGEVSVEAACDACQALLFESR
jgi:heptosyltransferase-3